ncbi:MFS transporter [Streptomyces sp. S.PB5]|uniref:MFS transporter n=1 Tax=Streptomyces sp. S.PB5 TaxID=3020844 RepID=UPI0025AEDE23|nr:MFS transporter [Streptomyces sp. S.PB5]MDN3028885.1 MFS transporter [Streptomyces sp. S.PB5]
MTQIPHNTSDPAGEPTSDLTRGTPATPARTRWAILAGILAADVLDLLDATITNVAAPTIATGLGGGPGLVQRLDASYAPALGVLPVPGGRPGDKYGRRRLFLLALTGFLVASLACGLAPDPTTLALGRLTQGAFGALVIPQGFGILGATWPRDQIGKAFALFGPAMGLSAVSGPILAGFLVDADIAGLGRRPLFLINPLLGGLTESSARGWTTAQALLLLPLGLIFFAAFCHRRRTGREAAVGRGRLRRHGLIHTHGRRLVYAGLLTLLTLLQAAPGCSRRRAAAGQRDPSGHGDHGLLPHPGRHTPRHNAQPPDGHRRPAPVPDPRTPAPAQAPAGPAPLTRRAPRPRKKLPPTLSHSRPTPRQLHEPGRQHRHQKEPTACQRPPSTSS